MSAMNTHKCADIDTFRVPEHTDVKVEKKLAVSAESIARALYKRPSNKFNTESALLAFAGARARRR